MGTNWTEQQCAVIDNRGGTLLVSAAAGSGKTAVLVERVLRRVSDPENPCDIDSFLIVTYTRAAAGEMRGKIAEALTELVTGRRSRRCMPTVCRSCASTTMSWDCRRISACWTKVRPSISGPRYWRRC